MRRPSPIVDAAWLGEQLAGAQPPLVVHTGWAGRGAADYRRAHVAGAIHLDTDAFEDQYPTWRLRSDAELRRCFGEHGIDAARTIVVYSAQGIAAARTWWVLHYAGAVDVRLLDGGLAAWRAAGGAIERAARRLPPVDFAARPRHEINVPTAELHARLGAVQLADVRSDAEFAGARSGYRYMAYAGRIPRAIALGDADDGAGVYLRADGRLRSLGEVDSRWRAIGLDPARELVFYCGCGWRSSLAFLYAHALGYARARNYSDGWAGWSIHYVRDAAAGQPTPGWRQLRTANPIESDEPGELFAAGALGA